MTKKSKTPKRLTKRQRKALEGKGNTMKPDAHIHCVACGRHVHQPEFTARPSTARWLRCQHGTVYASCVSCVRHATQLLAEHDRSGRPVQAASAWH